MHIEQITVGRLHKRPHFWQIGSWIHLTVATQSEQNAAPTWRQLAQTGGNKKAKKASANCLALLCQELADASIFIDTADLILAIHP